MITTIESREVAIWLGSAYKYNEEFDSTSTIEVVISEITHNYLPLCILNVTIADETGEFDGKITQRFESASAAMRGANKIGKMFGLPKINNWERYVSQ